MVNFLIKLFEKAGYKIITSKEYEKLYTVNQINNDKTTANQVLNEWLNGGDKNE